MRRGKKSAMRSKRINTHNTNVIARLVQVLAPQYPALDVTVRAAVQHDVTAFVVAQVKSMPSFLRVPYRLALVAFDWLAVLRYRKSFVALPDDKATAYLALWSDRGLGVTRDFVKLIRSCALLAYFDHPQVRVALEAAQPAQLAAQRAVGNGLD